MDLKEKELKDLTESEVKEFIKLAREFFAKEYAYVNFSSISDAIIWEFVNRPYVVGRSFDFQMNILYDWICSQDVTEITK